MCGLVYVLRKDGRPAYKSVLKRYRAQAERGKEGFGYVAIKNNEVVSYKRAPTEREIIDALTKEDANEILFHHRNPTSISNIEEAAHPILIENEMLRYQYFFVHNGVIRNDKELKKKHEELGFLYSTEAMLGLMPRTSENIYSRGSMWNDSEALAIETALAVEDLQHQIDTEGPAAAICIQTDKKRVLNRFFFRNNANPLVFHEDKVLVTLTSTGNGATVQPTGIHRLSKSGHELFGKIYSPLSYKATPYRITPPTRNQRSPDRGVLSPDFLLPAGRRAEHFVNTPSFPWSKQDSVYDDDDLMTMTESELSEEGEKLTSSITRIENHLRSIDAQITAGSASETLTDTREKIKNILDSEKNRLHNVTIEINIRQSIPFEG